MEQIIKCQKVLPGQASGEVLFTRMAISFWGGVDTATGEVTDPRHELFEKRIANKILVFPFAKGSAGASIIILELIARHTAPAAFINIEAEPLLISGPILGRHLYGIEIPMATVPPDKYELFQTGKSARVNNLTEEIRLTCEG